MSNATVNIEDFPIPDPAPVTMAVFPSTENAGVCDVTS